MNALDRAIQSAGNVSRLAEKIGTLQSTVSNWRARGQVPVTQCLAVETATESAVLCEDLRPDVTWQRDASGVVTGYVVTVCAADQNAS